jgi:hypothetical protein
MFQNNFMGIFSLQKHKCMFDFASSKIDFDRIDSVKLILAKIDFKLKWFMFEYIHVKVS